MNTPEPATLVDRLRGIYRLPVNDGAGPLNGSDEFVRKFDGMPPIHGEAADTIELLLSQIDADTDKLSAMDTELNLLREFAQQVANRSNDPKLRAEAIELGADP